ncbi:3-hydroxyacyl-CoA dehydrogenase NAD-binding domain-containing protein [Sphingobacterium sp. lm-10]|uniref:3-hydroxyacyl-CoA dehydrogenase NAD-binding domain-containing protein n=1 Tax=Sphingobacterium sp. lm-10 TaxID=2944904 RepID=UPI0020217352|nr:3-hydroxyacyl-CoA dehydrogenase NAD-binding domain-containing protein [Sphingobacterium sp. lm-10]MCL7986957.1 3-hydroxyacyl-CoA dehydrogenase NAD-binding domain-containing protein [Sphingobacterium sp. lm-10]
MSTSIYHKLFTVSQHDHGVLEITFEPDAKTMSPAHQVLALLTVADEWFGQEDIRAIYYHLPQLESTIQPDYISLVKSAKKEKDLSENLRQIQTLMEKIRGYRKALIAVLHGDCVGDNFAFALLADYRITIGSEGFVGFPETAFGLLPGLGSFSRMVQLWGEDFAFRLATQALLYNRRDALSIGIIDQEVEGIGDLSSSMSAYLHTPEAQQELSSDVKKNRELLPPSRINAHFPGVIACQKLLTKYKAGTDINVLIKEEHHLYVQVATSDQVVAMIRTNYYGINGAKQQIQEISETNARDIGQIGVIGAGMMGSGIAYEGARAGLQVTLLDTDLSKANHGKNYAQKVSDKLVSQDKMPSNEQVNLLKRITTSANFTDLYTADIVIEAVFEDMNLKTALIAEVSSNLGKSTAFASNTTSLPIGQLAQASQNPSSFIGLHFFSPVDRMPLVEVIIGPDTDEATKDTALQCVHLLGKIPIVVQDGPGFFTSRIFFNYLLEGITMVLEGVSPSVVELVARKAGFPVGPLLVLDEISLPLMLHVYDQFPTLHDAQYAAYAYLEQMIAEGRIGRKANAGFYQYDEHGKRGNLNEPLNPKDYTDQEIQDLGKRLLHVVALDAFRCLSSGIIAQPIDGDLGSVLGIGYVPHTGGVFAHIDQVGIATFVGDCERFASHGAQWEIPPQLRDLSAQNFAFYDGFQSNWNPS